MSYQRIHHHKRDRRGVIAVLAGLMIACLCSMVAFSVDYGYLLKIRTDLQRAADAAALAAVQDLIPSANGTQDLAQVRATVRAFVQNNLNDPSFQIADADIEIGRFDPDRIYSTVTLLRYGTFDAVRVTLRRDGDINPQVALFFARVFGRNSSSVVASATAVLQKAQLLVAGADVLPFATPKTLWDNLKTGEQWKAYGDGKVVDSSGALVSGNWGTLDIGLTDNSTSDLVDQIINGLGQEDIDALRTSDRISSDRFIDSSTKTWMNGDTGLSVGIKQGIEQIYGQKRLIPIYDELKGTLNGSNVDFGVVRWGVVTVLDAEWKGEKFTYIKLKKAHTFSGELRPQPNLSGKFEYIDGAYTSPVLVE